MASCPRTWYQSTPDHWAEPAAKVPSLRCCYQIAFANASGLGLHQQYCSDFARPTYFNQANVFIQNCLLQRHVHVSSFFWLWTVWHPKRTQKILTRLTPQQGQWLSRHMGSTGSRCLWLFAEFSTPYFARPVCRSFTIVLSADGAANPSVTPAPCLSTFDTLKLLGVDRHLAMQRKMKFVPLRSMATMPYRWNTSADWNLQRGSCTWRALQPGAWRQTRTSFCTMPCCRNGHAAMTCLNMRPRTIVHQHNLRVLQIGLPCFCRKDVKLLLSFIAYDFDARRAWIILVMVSSFTMTTQTANRFDDAGSQRLPIFCWVLRCCGIAAHTLQVQQQPAWQLHIV